MGFKPFRTQNNSGKANFRDKNVQQIREVAEAEYVAVNMDYESVEQQLAEMVKKIQEEPLPSTTSYTSSSPQTNPVNEYQMSDLESILAETKSIARLNVGSVPIVTGHALQFTVEEVLMGKIRYFFDVSKSIYTFFSIIYTQLLHRACKYPTIKWRTSAKLSYEATDTVGAISCP